MKTKEFIKRVEELGYKTRLNKTFIAIYNFKFGMCSVSRDEMFSINTVGVPKGWGANGVKLFDLIVEYAKTPIEDRE